MKIIVTGSLGNISKPLSEILIKDGHEITIVSGDPEKQEKIEAMGATAAIGTLQDEAFLTRTFAGAHAIYVMVPPNFSVTDSRQYYREIGSKYANAISHAGVTRVVHLSSLGADLDSGTGFILGSHDLEETLNSLPGVVVTHLRPGFFYTNLYGFTNMIKGMGFIGSNYGGDDKLVMAHPQDIAEAAAEELTDQSPEAGVRYVVSDDRTASEVAAVIGAAIGKPGMQWQTFSDEQTASAMQQNGLPAQIVRQFIEMGVSQHNGRLRKAYDDSGASVNGKIRVKEFAKEFAGKFATGGSH